MTDLKISRRQEYVFLAAITLIAICARFFRIGELPPGLHFDEAFESVQALDILRGQGLPVFFEGNYGVEPVFIYLIALFQAVFGPSAIAGRLIAALIGSVTVPALHLLVRSVFRRQNHDKAVLLGLLAALALALLYWHIHFSRLGIEPILVPLNAIFALYFLWQGLETGRPLPFIVAGAAVGFGPYTYPAGRLLPLLAAAVGIHWLLAHLDRLSSPAMRGLYVRGIILAVIAALVVFAPLGWYFARHPALLTQRISQVGVVAEGQGSESPLQSITGNLENTAYMYTVRGDGDPRNNVPGRSVLDMGWAALFLVGLSACIIRFRQSQYGLPMWWLIVMSVPTVLSEYAPHFRRALGASPAVAVFMAIGTVTLLEWLLPESRLRADTQACPYAEDCFQAEEPAPGLRPYLVVAVVALIWLYGAGASLSAYFVTWSQNPALYYAFDVGLQDIGEYVRDLPPDEMAYLSPVRQDHQTLVFTVGQEYRPKTFDGRRVLVLPPEDRAATYINLMLENPALPDRLGDYLPGLEKVHRFRDSTGDDYAVVYHVPAGHVQQVEPGTPVQAILGNVVALLGIDFPEGPIHAGDRLDITVYWRTAGEMEREYTASIQLHGPFNPAANGPLWAQEDAQPGKGTYPTTRWTPGETIIETYSLPIPPETPPGTYTLHASLYWLPALERLPVTQGGVDIGDSVRLGEIEVSK